MYLHYLLPILASHVGEHEREDLLYLCGGVSVRRPYRHSVCEVVRVLDDDLLGQLDVCYDEVPLTETVDSVHPLVLMSLASQLEEL